MPEIPFGKRLKSTKDRWMHYRFPQSELGKTLPAGKPSPIVESYTPQGNGFFILEGTENGNYYLEDTPDLQPVSADAADQSSLLWNLWYRVSDSVYNTVEYDKKQAGFVSEGFDKATDELVNDLGFAGNQLKYLIFAILSVAAVVLISNLKS